MKLAKPCGSTHTHTHTHTHTCNLIAKLSVTISNVICYAQKKCVKFLIWFYILFFALFLDFFALVLELKVWDKIKVYISSLK